MIVSRRLLTVALTSLVLLAQLLLAWHLPSHLHDHLYGHLSDQQSKTAASLQSGQPDNSNKDKSDEPCALGVNGHGVALASTLALNNYSPAQSLRCAYHPAHYTCVNRLPYHARGPPLHS